MPVKAVHRGERSIARRTLRISRRSTSITLEDAFWNALQEIAEAKGTSRAELIRKINQTRSHPNLSSAVRLFVLAYYRGLARLRPATRLGRSAKMPTGASPIFQLSAFAEA
jgi:predicted DNA-binding ribbon-helix-helix protein